MERRLLITIGDDPDSLYGVRFVSSFFRNREDLKLTLLHVAPHFESMDAGERPRLREMDDILSGIYAKDGQKVLEAGERILLEQDFSKHQFRTKLIRKQYGKIGDILGEAREGGAHAIVLGRRGHSILEKILYPRLSEEVMNLDVDVPLWVCRSPDRGLKDVLLCVDGSSAGFRALEQVGHMVGKEEEHQITLFHVDDGSSRDIETMMGTAKRRLLDHGIKDTRVSSLVVRQPDVAGAICREVTRGAYAVVALGRHGIRNEHSPDKPFMGSKSLELLEVLQSSALWVSN